MPIIFFSTLWAFCLSLSFSWLRTLAYRGSVTPPLGGVTVLIAQAIALYAFSFMDYVTIAYIWGVIFCGLIGLVSGLLPSLGAYLVGYLCLTGLISELSTSMIWLPIYGLIELSSTTVILFNGITIGAFIYAIGRVSTIQSFAVSYLLFLWGLFLVFFSLTAFGSSWGWPYSELEHIAAICLGSLAGFFILCSAPPIIKLDRASAMALSGGLGVVLAFLKCSVLLWGIGLIPFMISLGSTPSTLPIFSHLEAKGYHQSMITLVLCLMSTILSAIILKSVSFWGVVYFSL